VNLGSLVLGVLSGMLISLLAVGLVLVYRSDRFLNLSQGQLGAFPAVFMAKVVLDWGWGYLPAILIALAIGIGTGIAVERLFVSPMRRRNASSTSLLLLTLAVSQILAALLYVNAFSPNPVTLIEKGFPVPLHVNWTVGGVIFHGQDVAVLIVCPIVVGLLAAFLRFSLLGKKIRAVASNRDGARLCGISPAMVSALTWGIAGALSTLSAVLVAPSEPGQFSATALGPDQLLLALGAAAFGAFVSIPMALVGGVTLGVIQQVTLSITSNAGTAQLVVFLAILLVILVRGRLIASVFSTDGAVLGEPPRLRIPAAVSHRFIARNHLRLLGVAGLFVAVILPLLPGLRSNGNRFELTLVVLYAIVAISLTILIGWAGQLSLGQFAIVGVAAFVAARLAHHGWSIVALLLICGVVGAGVMLVVGLPALRIRGLTLAVTTLGFAVVASDWLLQQSWFSSSPGTILDLQPMALLRGLGHPSTQLSIYVVSVAVLALVAVAVHGLRESTPGRLIVAVRDDERAAAAHGVNPTTVKLAALAVSGFIAGMVGVLWADAWLVVNPDQFAPAVSLSILAIPVVGGLGSVGGAIAAAMVLYLPTNFLLGSQPALQVAFPSVLMLVVLMIYPTGIAGAAVGLWSVFLGKLEKSQRLSARSATTSTVLTVADVHVRFGGIRALQGASMEVHAGEIVGLIGPNGAGKSTLIDAISGVTRPARGSVTMLGSDVTTLPPDLRAGLGIGRSFQSAHLFPGLTVRETVQTMIGSRKGIGTVGSMVRAPWTRKTEQLCRLEADALITRMGLSDFADTSTGDLSTGTRRICDLTLQVAGKPKLLLLDEPTAGIAQRETEAFGPLLRGLREELECAIVIVEHDMPLLMDLCDRVYAMVEGQMVACGTPEEIRSNPIVIASYLGTDDVAITRSNRSQVTSVGAGVSEHGE
jgi:ABC-type branched-subunit amino acid transport system ATPase component/ABC-type branched-subunit amino acid transport system permease subunit